MNKNFDIIYNKDILRTYFFTYAAGGYKINLGLPDNKPKKIKIQVYFENMQVAAGSSIIKIESQMLKNENINVYAIKGDSVAHPYSIVYEFTNENYISDTQIFKAYLTSNNSEITQGYILLVLNFIY